jgi:hypothetical protein
MVGGSPALARAQLNGAVERLAAIHSHDVKRWFSAGTHTSSKALLRPHRVNESGRELRAVKAFYRAALLPPQLAGGEPFGDSHRALTERTGPQDWRYSLPCLNRRRLVA